MYFKVYKLCLTWRGNHLHTTSITDCFQEGPRTALGSEVFKVPICATEIHAIRSCLSSRKLSAWTLGMNELKRQQDRTCCLVGRCKLLHYRTFERT